MAALVSFFLSGHLLDLGVPSQIITSFIRHSNLDEAITIGIRILLIGAFITGLRRLYNWLHVRIEEWLFPIAYIAADDPAYLWVMAWIAQSPEAQRQISDFQLSTGEWRQVRQRSGNSLRAAPTTALQGGKNVSTITKSVGEQNASWSEKDIIGQVIPTYHRQIRIKHNGQYLWVSRNMVFFCHSQQRIADHIRIRTIAFKKDTLKNFLVAAHQAYFAKTDEELLIFHSKRIQAGWLSAVSRPSRPWSSVIFRDPSRRFQRQAPRRYRQVLVGQRIDLVCSSRDIQGIPHRRGYLFHGEPGSGKTTLATAIASKLRLDIYVVNPSQRGMDDAKLSKLFGDCPARSLILIEDIDCIFPSSNRGRASGVITESPEQEQTPAKTASTSTQALVAPGPIVTGQHDLAPSTVTLSGLLNAIDGVSSQEGCILVATTNHPEMLDPALSRPGRFDIRVPFTHAVPAQARALFLHFYPLDDFTNPTLDTLDLNEKRSGTVIDGQKDLDGLADRFTRAVFGQGEEEVRLSMAALQGYLLGYKEDPVAAVENAGEWAGGLGGKGIETAK